MKMQQNIQNLEEDRGREDGIALGQSQQTEAAPPSPPAVPNPPKVESTILKPTPPKDNQEEKWLEFFKGVGIAFLVDIFSPLIFLPFLLVSIKYGGNKLVSALTLILPPILIGVGLFWYLYHRKKRKYMAYGALALLALTFIGLVFELLMSLAI